MTLEFFDSSGSVLTTVNYEANGSGYMMTASPLSSGTLI
jgi:hypothetical protein